MIFDEKDLCRLLWEMLHLDEKFDVWGYDIKKRPLKQRAIPEFIMTSNKGRADKDNKYIPLRSGIRFGMKKFTKNFFKPHLKVCFGFFISL